MAALDIAKRLAKAHGRIGSLTGQLDRARLQFWHEAMVRTQAEADRDAALRDLAEVILERDVLAGYAATLEAELADQIPGRGWHPSLGTGDQ